MSTLQNSDREIREGVEKIKKEILAQNIKKWDIYILDRELFGIYFKKTEKALNTTSRNLSYFIRIFTDKNDKEMGVGLASLNTISPSTITLAVKKAKAIAKINSETKYELVSPGLKYPSPKTYDKEIWEDPETFLEEKGKEIKKVISEKRRNAHTSFGKFRTYRVKKMLINSNGLDLLKKSTYFYYEFSIVARENNKMAEYWPRGYIKSKKHLLFEDGMMEWVALARDALRATRPSSFNKIEVLLPPAIIRNLLLSTLGVAIKADALVEKTTPFRYGEKQLSEKLTIEDDGLREGLLNTSAWDSEGNPKKKTLLIDKGVVKNFLFDQKFASLLGKTPTGNAQKKTEIGGIIDIEINNLIVKEGDHSLREIVDDTKRAIYINEFSWLRPSAITGTFGAEIKYGYMIENGELSKPIRGGNLFGNVYTMLKNVIDISKERRVITNTILPFIKFDGQTLSS